MIALAYEKGFHRYEWVYVNLQGENFDAEVTLTKIEDNEDIFLHVHLRDITKKLQEAKELEKLRERNELAITGSNDGLWDWDVTANKLYLSPKWKAILGYEDDELESSFESFKTVTHPDDFQSLMDVVYEHFRKRDSGIEFLVRMKHKNGRYIWLYDKGKALFDEDGKAYRMVGFISDVNDLMLSRVRSSLV
ncbi:PAS domain-containing protein [Sulfurimonas sp. MAG313]|nr:PAS domain-containing protein [Sulfurimonas sp. MAG313]